MSSYLYPTLPALSLITNTKLRKDGGLAVNSSPNILFLHVEGERGEKWKMSCKCNLFTQDALVNQMHLIIKGSRKKLAGFYKSVFFFLLAGQLSLDLVRTRRETSVSLIQYSAMLS